MTNSPWRASCPPRVLARTDRAKERSYIMRYQVPVTVTLQANGPDEAKATVQRLADQAPQALGVRTDGFRFTVGAAVLAEAVRTNRTANLSDDEFAVAQEAVARYRQGNG